MWIKKEFCNDDGGYHIIFLQSKRIRIHENFICTVDKSELKGNGKDEKRDSRNCSLARQACNGGAPEQSG